ncbi:MAG: hypothetical protein ACAI35_18465 [Candidatus Methylacidiphilales bacterium]|nr:hypothetical protein [Candidatus Methylacidiphilales bacterium]
MPAYIQKIILVLVSTLCLQLCINVTSHAQEPLPPQDYLRDAQGKLRAPAIALLESLEKKAQSDIIQSNAKALIKAGGLDLVLGLLNDRFEFSELDIAVVLSEIKTKKVAAALLARYKNSDDTPLWRGEDELFFRSEAKIILEQSLTKVTGVELEQTWSFEQRVNAFAARVKKMKT